MEYHYPRVVTYQSLSSGSGNSLLLTPVQTDGQNMIMMQRTQAIQSLAQNVEDMHEIFIDSQLAIDYGELLDDIDRDIMNTEEQIKSTNSQPLAVNNAKKKCSCYTVRSFAQTKACTKLLVLLAVSSVVVITVTVCIIIFTRR